MIWCQLKLTSRTNYLRRKASDDCLNWQGCQGVFFYSNANLEMFLPPNCRSMQKISHGTDKIWQRRGAARQHCAHKPLTSADPSGDFIPKMVQICALPKRRRIEASPKFRDTSQNIKAVEWQHVRCACNQKSAVFQDNRGRISSCLKGPSWQSWDLKTPLSGLRLRRSPKVGWVQQSSCWQVAMQWGLYVQLASAHLTSCESTRKSLLRIMAPTKLLTLLLACAAASHAQVYRLFSLLHSSFYKCTNAIKLLKCLRISHDTHHKNSFK